MSISKSLLFYRPSIPPFPPCRTNPFHTIFSDFSAFPSHSQMRLSNCFIKTARLPAALPRTTAPLYSHRIRPASLRPASLRPHHLTTWRHLIRLDKPTGAYLLLLPCYLGIAAGWTHIARLPAEAVHISQMADPTLPVLFLIGAFTMRSAGCIINDLFDRNIDKHVERTKTRPIASGAISAQGATAWLTVHLAAGLAVLLSLHPACTPLALAAVPLVACYPLTKRCMDCPQLILGMCFNSGIFVGNAAVLGAVDWVTCFTLYAACIAWTILYDTVYAFQDIRDDRRIGVRSFAIYLNGRKDHLVHAIIAVSNLMAMAGLSAGQSGVYYGCLAGALGYLYNGFRKLNEKDTAQCAAFFRMNVRFGWMCVAAWVLGNCAQFVSKGGEGSAEEEEREKLRFPAQKVYFMENVAMIRSFLS